MAEAHEVQRLRAAELLVAGLEVDRRVVRAGAGVVVEVAPVDVDVDALEPVDRAAEAAEVHVDDVVDVDVQQVADRADRELRAAEVVGLVDLALPVAGDLDLEVARDRHDRHRVLVGVQADDDDRVRARPDLADVGEAAVGAEQEDRLRLAGGHVLEELLDVRDPGRSLLEGVDVVVDLEQQTGRHRRGGEHHDEQGAEHELLDHAEVKPRVIHPGSLRRHAAGRGQARSRRRASKNSSASARGSSRGEQVGVGQLGAGEALRVPQVAGRAGRPGRDVDVRLGVVLVAGRAAVGGAGAGRPRRRARARRRSARARSARATARLAPSRGRAAPRGRSRRSRTTRRRAPAAASSIVQRLVGGRLAPRRPSSPSASAAAASDVSGCRRRSPPRTTLQRRAAHRHLRVVAEERRAEAAAHEAQAELAVGALARGLRDDMLGDRVQRDARRLVAAGDRRQARVRAEPALATPRRQRGSSAASAPTARRPLDTGETHRPRRAVARDRIVGEPRPARPPPAATARARARRTPRRPAPVPPREGSRRRLRRAGARRAAGRARPTGTAAPTASPR